MKDLGEEMKKRNQYASKDSGGMHERWKGMNQVSVKRRKT